jgi:hypothetical protein
MPTELGNVKIDWNKSYIWTPVAYGVDTAFSVVLGVTYKRLPPGAWDQLNKNSVPGL